MSEHLEVYQAAREFRKGMYRVAGKLPGLEKFELASQIRRTAVSLTYNIADGHGCYHYLGQIKFTLQAGSSLQELIDDLNVCDDEHHLPANEIVDLKQNGWRVYQLLNGYIRKLHARKTGGALTLHETSPPYGMNDNELDALLNNPI